MYDHYVSSPMDLTKPTADPRVTASSIAESRKASLLRRCSGSLHSDSASCSTSTYDSDGGDSKTGSPSVTPTPAPPAAWHIANNNSQHHYQPLSKWAVPEEEPNKVPMEAGEEDLSEYTCQICGDTAKYKMLKNYGAFSCFSCRAFFRRAHENCGPGESPAFKCRAAKLERSQAKRKRCRHCRLERCYAAGMKAEKIMDDEGKRKRFKRYSSWKTSGGKAIKTMKMEGGDKTATEDAEEQQEEEEEDRPMGKVSPSFGIKHEAAANLSSQPLEAEHATPKPQDREELPSEYSHWLTDLNTKLNHGESSCRRQEGSRHAAAKPSSPLRWRQHAVRESYKSAMYNPELYQMVVGCVSSESGEASKLTGLYPLHFARILRAIERQFFRYASEQRAFAALPPHARGCAFNNAAALFVHLLIGKTFVAKTGFQQLGSLVGSTLHDDEDDSSRNLERVTFREFSAMTGFFSAAQSELETRYMLLIMLRLRTLPVLALDLATLANLVLFGCVGLEAAGHGARLARGEAAELAKLAGRELPVPAEIEERDVAVFMEVLCAMKNVHVEAMNLH